MQESSGQALVPAVFSPLSTALLSGHGYSLRTMDQRTTWYKAHKKQLHLNLTAKRGYLILYIYLFFIIESYSSL